MILPILFIAQSTNKGKGVFTATNIPANTVIEIAAVVTFSNKERVILEQTKLYNYIFEWGKSRKKAALALGYASLYNHSYTANCEYDMNFENETITIKTIKNITKGEELFINYNATANDATPIWFNAK